MKSVIRKIAIENHASNYVLEWLHMNENKSDAWLYNNCIRPDWLVWWLRNSRVELPKETWVKIAEISAESCLGIFKKKHPKDSRPRKAIEAAKAWLANPASASAASAAAYAAAEAVDATTEAVDAVTSEKIRELVPWVLVARLVK